MNSNLTRAFFAALALFCAGFVMHSAAGGAVTGEPLKHVVSYGDLDLNQPEGIVTLYTRVQAAAIDVCAPVESVDMSRRAHLEPCIADATSRAVKSVNVPALTAYNDLRDGRGGYGLVAGQP
jgi:UrcA family protein